MKKMLLVALAASMTCGCTSTFLVDIDNGDAFSYRYYPWQSRRVEEAAARVRYWGNVGPKHYGTNEWLRLDMILVNGTNVVKEARYWFQGKKEN